MILRLIVTTTLTCLLPGLVESRPIREWTYEELMEKADMVVIAQAVSENTTTNTRPEFQKSWPDVSFVGLNTLFKVKLALKGEVNAGRLTVFHFRICEMPNGIRNGPMFVVFQIGDRKLPHGGTMPPPDYMLFLRRLEDGRYEPVSGQMDPVIAVKELDDDAAAWAKMYERTRDAPTTPRTVPASR